MAEKEYIISLKRGVDYTAFDDEMQAGIGRGLITNRSVVVAMLGHYHNVTHTTC